MDFGSAIKLQCTIDDASKLIDTVIFTENGTKSPFFRASFVQLLIFIRDLMAKCDRNGNRIKFDDDIFKYDNISDVTDLIVYVRNAICHLESQNHYLNKNVYFSFNCAIGKCSMAIIDGIEIKSDYEDDICVFFGPSGIYIKRHLFRAFAEARNILEPEIRRSMTM